MCAPARTHTHSRLLLILMLKLKNPWYISSWGEYSKTWSFAISIIHYVYWFRDCSLGYVDLFCPSSCYCGFKRSQNYKQVAASRRKHVVLIIPQTLEIIRELRSVESNSVVVAVYNSGLSSVYDINKRKDQFWSFMAWSDNMKVFWRDSQVEQGVTWVIYSSVFWRKPVPGPVMMKKLSHFLQFWKRA